MPAGQVLGRCAGIHNENALVKLLKLLKLLGRLQEQWTRVYLVVGDLAVVGLFRAIGSTRRGITPSSELGRSLDCQLANRVGTRVR